MIKTQASVEMNGFTRTSREQAKALTNAPCLQCLVAPVDHGGSLFNERHPYLPPATPRIPSAASIRFAEKWCISAYQQNDNQQQTH